MKPIIPTELIAPIFDPATYTDPPRVDAIFARLRRDYPLAVAEVPGYDPHWIVTRNADIREITRQDEIFHNGDRSKMLVSKAGEQLIREYTGGQPNILKTLVHMDEPEHTDYRNVTQDAFLPQAVASLEPQIRETARDFCERLARLGTDCDFAADIAFRYPLKVVGDIIGVPEADQPTLLRLTQWMFNYADPDLRRPGATPTDPLEQTKTWKMVYDEFKSYYDGVITDRQKCPRSDLASVIANAKVNGCPMERHGQISYFIIASTAGHDTTAATTAAAMWVLAEHPEILPFLKADLNRIPVFLEEVIRWATPVKHFVRSAARDYELRGQRIEKGDLLYLAYASGNRDEEAFPDPNTFKADRKPNRHIGFGFGNHICLGQHLARLELRVFWEELIPRLEAVELAGKPQLAVADLVCGPKSVPIHYRMSRRMSEVAA
jgi:cytochrome P450